MAQMDLLCLRQVSGGDGGVNACQMTEFLCHYGADSCQAAVNGLSHRTGKL